MSLRFLGLSGSLRAESTNAAVLRTLADLLPDGVSLDLYDYRDVPLYDPDAPELAPGVVRLRDAITAADAVVIATPEYNYSVPGVLKNAIDHASRPAYQSPFRNKPVGVLSASPGLQGERGPSSTSRPSCWAWARRSFLGPRLRSTSPGMPSPTAGSPIPGC